MFCATLKLTKKKKFLNTSLLCHATYTFIFLFILHYTGCFTAAYTQMLCNFAQFKLHKIITPLFERGSTKQRNEWKTTWRCFEVETAACRQLASPESAQQHWNASPSVPVEKIRLDLCHWVNDNDIWKILFCNLHDLPQLSCHSDTRSRR